MIRGLPGFCGKGFREHPVHVNLTKRRSEADVDPEYFRDRLYWADDRRRIRRFGVYRSSALEA